MRSDSRRLTQASSLVLAGVFIAISWAAPGFAQDGRQRLEESPRHHEWINVATPEGRSVRTWVVFPEVDGPAPAVVVIHENRGLNDWARSVADRLAEEGYVALAPDLLSGEGPNGGGTSSFASTDDARNAIYALPPEQVIEDLDAVIAHAQAMPATSDVVTVAGFCWGGARAWDVAVHNDGIAAVFVFYGSAPRDLDSLESIKVPVYGFYGGDDFRITGAVPDVQKAMDERGKTFDATIYKGAGHAFMRSGEAIDGAAANINARNLAWERWLDLLEKHR